MRAIFIAILATLISACQAENPREIKPNQIILPTSNPAFKAASYLGYTEQTHRAELREFTGVDPVRTEWCAAFVNSVLEESNIPSNRSHRYPLTARAFLDWGTAIERSKIEPGDIVIFPRGNIPWQGHVGFFLRKQEINGVEHWWILGGNQSNKVSVVMYRASYSIGVRRHII
jgi:uncharacterized protein (TIGR02594 family)